tara:strand:- start:202 stop:369 length:168 start_codon:yes stop_codon:yes gene_type:complete
MTKKQAHYLLALINRKTGKGYRFLSQVSEGKIGKRMNKVRGISSAEASALISEWE